MIKGILLTVLSFGIFSSVEVKASPSSENYLMDQIEMAAPPVCTPSFAAPNPTGTCPSGYGFCEEVTACPDKPPVFTTVCVKCPKGCQSGRYFDKDENGCELTKCTCKEVTPD